MRTGNQRKTINKSDEVKMKKSIETETYTFPVAADEEFSAHGCFDFCFGDEN